MIKTMPPISGTIEHAEKPSEAGASPGEVPGGTEYRPYEGGRFGMPSSVQGPATTAPTTPLPKRPKGRLLIGSALCACLVISGYQIWQTFFRHQAHGTICGRVISVNPPWNGVLTALHVQEGDQIRQGQLLATVTSVL